MPHYPKRYPYSFTPHHSFPNQESPTGTRYISQCSIHDKGLNYLHPVRYLSIYSSRCLISVVRYYTHTTSISLRQLIFLELLPLSMFPHSTRPPPPLPICSKPMSSDSPSPHSTSGLRPNPSQCLNLQ